MQQGGPASARLRPWARRAGYGALRLGGEHRVRPAAPRPRTPKSFVVVHVPDALAVARAEPGADWALLVAAEAALMGVDGRNPSLGGRIVRDIPGRFPAELAWNESLKGVPLAQIAWAAGPIAEGGRRRAGARTRAIHPTVITPADAALLQACSSPSPARSGRAAS